jgi:4-amino-4-deoxy-L-arabinose transferase-like glycosyltransferase
MLRRAALFAVLLALVFCAAGAFQRGLWAPDEPREAEIGREMLVSRWSAVPTLGGEAFLEKPPLFAWVMAASYALFGDASPGAARVPAVLFSALSVVVAYLLGRRCGGRFAGLCAAAVLVACYEFARISHSALIDTALTFFVATGHLALLTARDAVRVGRRTSAFVVAGVLAGLAFLTKGLVGPVLVVAPPLLAAAVAREGAFLRAALPRVAAWSTAFVLLLGGPWVLALAHDAGWKAVGECLVRNTLARAIGKGPESANLAVHDNPPWYYLEYLPLVLLPWTLAIPALVADGTLRRRADAGRTKHLALLALAGIVLLSIPSGKRTLYLVPLLPAVAAVFGVWLSRAGSTRTARADRATSIALLVVVAAAAAVVAYVLCGGPLPSGASSGKYRGLLDVHGATATAYGVACGFAAAFVACLAFGDRRGPAQTSVRHAVAAVLAAVFAWHALGTPLLDSAMDLRPGAARISSLVPPDEPLLVLAPDETTRAALTFGTGRTLSLAYSARGVRDRLAGGGIRHVVVLESGEKCIDAPLRAQLRLVESVHLNWERVVNVYDWTGG